MRNGNIKTSYTLEDIKKLNKNDFSSKEKFILLLGETGKGKSTFVNQITGKKECNEEDGPENVTTQTRAVPLDYKGYKFYFIDTPGLNEDINNIKYIMKKLRITTFIIVLSFNDIRITRLFQQFLIEFMNSFPAKSFWKNVIVIRNYNFEEHLKGKLLEIIKKNEEIINCMNKNKIDIPDKIQEFFIDLKSNDSKKKLC